MNLALIPLDRPDLLVVEMCSLGRHGRCRHYQPAPLGKLELSG